jgi:hypothetical protein
MPAGKVVDAPTATDLVLREGAVEFRDVSFGYEAGLSVLKGVRRQAAFFVVSGNEAKQQLHSAGASAAVSVVVVIVVSVSGRAARIAIPPVLRRSVCTGVLQRARWQRCGLKSTAVPSCQQLRTSCC